MEFELNAKRGKNTVMANAINTIGQTQTATLIFNPAGYHNNVMQRHAERELKEGTMRTIVFAVFAALIALPGTGR